MVGGTYGIAVIDDSYKVMVVPEGSKAAEVVEFWRKNKVKVMEIGGKRRMIMGVKHLKEICRREDME